MPKLWRTANCGALPIVAHCQIVAHCMGLCASRLNPSQLIACLRVLAAVPIASPPVFLKAFSQFAQYEPLT
jgi:hypothetical protein